MNTIPLFFLFAITIIIILLSVELGYRLARRRAPREKEPPISAISASCIGLLAFILAFTFGIVNDRYSARASLIREEANAIGTAYLRADFISQPDRDVAKSLIREYLEIRLAATRPENFGSIKKLLAKSKNIQNQLWNMAVVNARKDMNSDVAALYIDSLNKMIDLQAMRISIGLQSKVSSSTWLALYTLIVLGAVSLGYQLAIVGSSRSWATPILAISISIVIVMIVSLDRPNSYLLVSQQPLIDLHALLTNP